MQSFSEFMTGVSGTAKNYQQKLGNQLGRKNFQRRTLYDLIVQNIQDVAQGQKQSNLPSMMAILLKRVANDILSGKVQLNKEEQPVQQSQVQQ